MAECPYAERKGLAVYCKLANKKVSPLRYPCFSSHWQKCPIYREMAPKLEAEKKEERKEVKEERRVEEKPREAPAGRPALPSAGFKKPEEARTCHECIFYSELTGMCLKLKIRVKDPNNPPCKSGST